MTTNAEILAMADTMDNMAKGWMYGFCVEQQSDCNRAAEMLRKIAEEWEWRNMDSAPKGVKIILKIPNPDTLEAFSTTGEFKRGAWYFSNIDADYSCPIGNDFDDPIGWKPMPPVEA